MLDIAKNLTSSASVHALTGSSRPGAAPTVTLGATAAADGSTSVHADADLIELAARVVALADRHERVYGRMLVIHGRIDRWSFAHRPERPQDVPSEMTLVRTQTDTHEVTHIEQPLTALADQKARREAIEAATTAHEAAVERRRARTREPYLDKLQARMWRRLECWTRDLTIVEPQTQSGLAAKAAASAALVNVADDMEWTDELFEAVSRDALRIIGAEANARAEQDRQADGELFALIARHGEVIETYRRADAAADGPLLAYEAATPDTPPALVWRPADNTPRATGLEIVAGSPTGYAAYTAADIAKLRVFSPPARREETREPAPWGGDDQILRVKKVPDERLITRCAEIVATSDAWEAEKEALRDSTGYTAALAAERAASERVSEVATAILDMVPHTFAGLQAKARWIEGEDASDDWSGRVLRDVLAMPTAVVLPASNLRPASLARLTFPAGRYPVGASRDVVEGYRTFLEMELRFLNHEVYGQTEGGPHYWLDNPAGRLHSGSHAPATSRAAAVLGLLGLMPAAADAVPVPAASAA